VLGKHFDDAVVTLSSRQRTGAAAVDGRGGPHD
jgi:hypothetical protein